MPSSFWGKFAAGILHSNRPELAEAFMREATASDYEHLLSVCMRYVDIR
jgi:hypothetical protein